ncbi:UNVERIFIED_CONTAM: hypothetical protein Sradi_2343600 [Sesamum radiatum]|uniref:Uncharacterized protein n=1 Tax=Sesamum radiatum TaxID=300843 RepID=A0AAW2T5G2_SESRA
MALASAARTSGSIPSSSDSQGKRPMMAPQGSSKRAKGSSSDQPLAVVPLQKVTHSTASTSPPLSPLS